MNSDCECDGDLNFILKSKMDAIRKKRKKRNWTVIKKRKWVKGEQGINKVGDEIRRGSKDDLIGNDSQTNEGLNDNLFSHLDRLNSKDDNKNLDNIIADEVHSKRLQDLDENKRLIKYQFLPITKSQNIFTNQDSQLFYHFLNHFIPSISSNSKFFKNSDNLFINLSKSPALIEIFLCFGAIYLSKISTKNYLDLAEIKYSSALSIIGNDLKNNDLDFANDWLYTTGLCLCLTNGATDLNEKKCLQQLILIFNLFIDKFNKLQYNKINNLSNAEKLFIHNLTFHYSCALISFNNSNLIKLPSPCDVFLKLRLAYPSLNNNNYDSNYDSIFTNQINTFEIICKIIWLLRLHSQSMYDTNQDFYINDFNFWKFISQIKPIFKFIDENSSEIKFNLEKIKISDLSNYENLRSHLSISIIINNSAKILYEKATNPTLPAFVPMIQDPVNLILEELANIIQGSSCWICVGLLIAGSSTINKYQRSLIISKLTSCPESGLGISSTLQKAWNREYSDQIDHKLGDKGYKPFDLIFDRQSMESLEL